MGTKPNRGFTDDFLRKVLRDVDPLKPPFRLWEGRHNPPGFGAQFSPGGTVTFFVRMTVDGKRTFPSVGRWPQVSISEARDRAWSILRLHQNAPWVPSALTAPNPSSPDVNRATKIVTVSPWGTFKQLADAYVWDLRSRGCRSATDRENALLKDAIPLLGSKAANTVTSADITDVIKRVWDRGSKGQSDSLRSMMSSAFNLGLRYDNKVNVMDRSIKFAIKSNPVDATEKSNAGGARLRFLSIEEIADAWANPALTPLHQYMLRLLFLSYGQRPSEILQTPWSAVNFDLGTITITSDRTKNEMDNVVPLTATASIYLQSLRELFPTSTYLIPGRNDTAPINVQVLALAVKEMLRGKGVSDESRWVPYCVRATCKTWGGKAGLSKEIRDRLQNHALKGDVSAKHYDMYDYVR